MLKLQLAFIILTLTLALLVYLEVQEYNEQYQARMGTLVDFNSFK